MILVVDYEPRTVARVNEALASLGRQVIVANDLDAAVNACATSEPEVVLITSMLPRLTVEDAITQLRARAGLRATPFLVLASGYSGDEPRADAAALGAQSMLGKPFSDDELRAATLGLLEHGHDAGQESAEPRETVLDSLRRGAEGAGEVTSEELFGDLFGDEEEQDSAATQHFPVQPIPAPGAATGADAKAAATGADATTAAAGNAEPEGVDSTLANLGRTPAPERKPTGTSSTKSVDDLLSQTLSGLEVNLSPKPRPAATKPSTPPAPSEPVAPPAPSQPAAPAEPAAAPEAAAPGASAPEERSEAPAGETAPPEAAAPAPAAADDGPAHAGDRAPAPDTPPVEADAPPAAERDRQSGPLPGGTPFGQYELMELIATGGMAEVYKARMRGVEGFQKIVAIKRILPHLTNNDEFVTMFIDEAKLAAQLQHPNIIHIYDLGKIEKSYYIAMEYIHGKDLRSILRELAEKNRRMPVPLAVFVGSRLAAALDYAHRKRDLQGSAMSLVHRDVSPQNVLISHDGDIKLCDFGIAKAASKASHTRAGALKGKLQYMSPEQAWGKDLDHRSDIFSLGLVLYEMVTGRKAFAGDSELSVLEQVRSPRLTPPREVDPAVPAELDTIIMKALREDRDTRYQTASSLASDLESVLQTARPAPGAAELGAFLTRLDADEDEEEIAAGGEPAAERPEPEAAPAAAPEEPQPDTPAVVAAPVDEGPEDDALEAEPAKRGAPVALIAAAAVVVVAAGLWFLLGRTGPTTPEDPANAPAAAETAPLDGATTPAGDAAEGGGDQNAVLPPDTSGSGGGSAVPAAAVSAVLPEPTATPSTAAAAAAVPVQATVPPALPTPQPTAVGTPDATATPLAEVVPTTAPTPIPTAAPPTPTPAPTRPQPTPTPTVHEGDLVEFPDVPAEPISMARPRYPTMARRQRQGGIVILRALVNERGEVERVEVLRGVTPDYGLDEAAAAALRTWRFRPATKNGVRVKTWYNTTIPFQP